MTGNSGRVVHGPSPAGAEHRPYTYVSATVTTAGGQAAALRRGMLLLAMLAGAAVVGVTVAVLAGEPSQPRAAGSAPAASPAPRRAAAEHNALYDEGPVTDLSCKAPTLRPADTGSMDAFLATVGNCLNRLWSKEFSRAGLPFRAPARVLWSEPGTSPCGSFPAPGAAAFFCATDDAIYVGLSDVVTASAHAPGWAYSIYASVFAHEYGHHVQNQAGILGYGDRAEGSAPNRAARMAVSRRIELQANCFDGTYLGTVARSLPLDARQRRIVMQDAEDRGDRRPGTGDHGSRAHFSGWLARGMDHGGPGACNTWLAAASDVS